MSTYLSLLCLRVTLGRRRDLSLIFTILHTGHAETLIVLSTVMSEEKSFQQILYKMLK